MATKYDVETVVRIHSEHGWFIEIGPYADGIDMLDVRYFNDTLETKAAQSVSIPLDMVPHVIAALTKLIASEP